VAVLRTGEFMGVASSGRAWLLIQDRIRPVLLLWDPIGLGDLGPADEYDSYIGGIYTLLRRGAAREEIAEHLGGIEMERMGMEKSPESHRLRVADELLGLELPDPVLERMARRKESRGRREA
jgi:hypothetical protein